MPQFAPIKAARCTAFILISTLEVLLRFKMVVGIAFGTLAACFIIVAEWFANTRSDKTDLRKPVPLYLMGAVAYGVAGALYASSIMERIPLLGFTAATSLPASVLLSVSYWKNPGRPRVSRLILGQLSYLFPSAITASGSKSTS